MNKLLLVSAFSILAATPALAQINMAWRNCYTVTSGASAARFNENSYCDGVNLAGPFTGVVSFIAPPNVTQFVGVQITMDIQTYDVINGYSALWDYWRMGIGECREGSFVAPLSLSGIGTGSTGTCQNPFAGANTTGAYSYVSDSPCAGHATVTFSMVRDTPRSLTAGQQYVAEAFSIDTYRGHDDGQGSGVCTGCFAPAWLSVKKLEIRQLSPETNYLLTDDAARKWITWQGGVPEYPCDGPVPTSNRTWGAIKAIYR